MARFSRDPVHDGEILTLRIEEGKKWNQATGDGAIASIDRCIVFAPRGAVPGRDARLKLHVLKNQDGAPRTDAGGYAMYRGEPAPAERVERWRLNADGTASRIAYSVDWKLKETEVGVLETRPLAKRQAASWTRQDLKVIWGVDQASSYVERTEVEVIPQEAEKADGGQLVWARVGEREERRTPERLPILRVSVGAGDLDVRRRELTYDSGWSLTILYIAQKTVVGCTESLESWENSVWGRLPPWLQAQVQVAYPVCACKRQRVDSSDNTDGYSKCRQCRDEEACSRCSKPGRATVVAGALVCADCKPLAKLEELVHQHVSDERRAELAAQAERLLAGQAVPGEAGEIILRSTFEHVPAGWSRDRLLQKCAGFAWYYFCSDGVWGSRFSNSALEVLRFYGQAAGNGLVELTAWLIGPHRKSGGYEQSYFHQTQVLGQTATPSFGSSDLALAVAERLRGSEDERLAVIEGYRRLAAKLGDDHPSVQAVATILQAEEQDYAAAMAVVRAAERKVSRSGPSYKAGGSAASPSPATPLAEGASKPLTGETLQNGLAKLRAKFGGK